MKPFDIVAALHGKLLISRDGKNINIRITRFDFGEFYPLQGSVDSERYTLDGKYLGPGDDHPSDLLMQEDSDLVDRPDNGNTIIELTLRHEKPVYLHYRDVVSVKVTKA